MPKQSISTLILNMPANSSPTPQLGIPGFTIEDLHDPQGLKRLAEKFDQDLAEHHRSLFDRFDRYRQGQEKLGPVEESELLIQVARHVSKFLAQLFGLEREVEALARALLVELPLFEFKREFMAKRVFRKGALDRPAAGEFPALDAKMGLLLQLGFPDALKDRDSERALAQTVTTLLQLERLFGAQTGERREAPADSELLRERWQSLRQSLLATQAGRDVFGAALCPTGSDSEELKAIRALISLADRWTYARALHPVAKRALKNWSTHKVPKPLVFDQLVELRRPDPNLPETAEGLAEHLRRRDGFKLTDRRYGVREIMAEVDYCILCHERQKDSCARGFIAKDPVAEGNTFKKNPLGIPLTGCPLDERISEAHALKAKGDSIASLAMIMLDNPMVPGTGHRICNDCMKSCIYQKQEPVNIPQIETSVLIDVLNLPWGFELYGLLTRWNPLNIARPYALPYLGKNVLVVGLGPAGYTLAHFLLNEGFGVVGIDGLKIEPFPGDLASSNGARVRPIRDLKEISRELDDRVLAGFGGVSEYGITVRWDKNFLTLLHLTLARRTNLRMYGGVRFGGTLTAEDAWELGFDHIAIASGAGKPTVIPMKNNLIRGIRKASDFLMALQLTGAFKTDSLANLQVQLPAVVIGGGLTAIDTATELAAYYPVQVEKVLARYEAVSGESGEASFREQLDEEERIILDTFLAHGRAVRAERARALAAGEPPNVSGLVAQWGGVSICYRRGLTESPAYRLNHEEVAKALEEGIRFIERMSPVEAVPNSYGAVKAIRFERMSIQGGKLKGSGEFFELPARSVCVAAGTSPNISYEKERRGTFELDDAKEFFRSFEAIREGAKFVLKPVQSKADLAAKVGFFTSYNQDGRFVTFYGDNHPTYAGNVVKAMASAKDGFPKIVELFSEELAAAGQSPSDQRQRDLRLRSLFDRLDDQLQARVEVVNRLTPTIVEVVVKAPVAARHFQPGQFYRLQNFETLAPYVKGTRLAMEGLALTGAWVDRERGLLSTIVLEMGSSSRLCAILKPGDPVVLMGPTGTPTEIPKGEMVILVGGGLGNAVLFSIAKSLKAAGNSVIYFAGYRQRTDSFKREEIESGTDQVIWSVDSGDLIEPCRACDATFRGNVVEAMLAYAQGRISVSPRLELGQASRVIAIGSDRMMRAVKEARHGVLRAYLKPQHEAIGSINSPMQCMMKEICAQCLQRHVDPVTRKETFVFSCFNQDQKLDHVDFSHLSTRLKANSVLEKLSNQWLDFLLMKDPSIQRV